MIYGLYQSAAGMMTATHRQNVIANNLANAETTGFRRDFAFVQERKLAAQELPTQATHSDRFFDALSGGQLLSRSESDFSPGTREETGNTLDAALGDKGFFVVQKDGKQYLTRNGSFAANAEGHLVLSGEPNALVLGSNLQPLKVNPAATSQVAIDRDGQIRQGNAFVGNLAIKDAPQRSLTKAAGQLFESPEEISSLPSVKSPWVEQGSLERSNVDATTEITAMMESMRQLEANANMIRYQDQTLGRLVNDVAKI